MTVMFQADQHRGVFRQRGALLFTWGTRK